MSVTQLKCSCGTVRLEARGRPIMTTECHCTSCRTEGAAFSAFAGTPPFLSTNNGTPFVMMRKDRVRIVAGAEHLTAYSLGDSSTRRVLAACCNTPVFLEFENGHWLSIYVSVWPRDSLPKIELRTMTSDLPEGSQLDDAIPSSGLHTLGFYAKLLTAWIAMGFKSPRIEVGRTVKLPSSGIVATYPSDIQNTGNENERQR